MAKEIFEEVATVKLTVLEIGTLVGELVAVGLTDLPVPTADEQVLEEWSLQDRGNAIYQLEATISYLQRAVSMLRAVEDTGPPDGDTSGTD